MLNFILSKNVTRTVLKDKHGRTLRAPDRYLLGDLDTTDGYSDATNTRLRRDVGVIHNALKVPPLFADAAHAGSKGQQD